MIETHALTKRLGGRAVVDDVSFACRPGTVTGFLGPNGAGKSTTMRMLCGLARPDGGTATVLGKPFGQIQEPGREVGILLDASAQHAGRRGEEVLRLSAATMGVPSTQARELLDRVGLPRAAARKRVGEYSLGMRQRLGIAQALVGDPKVLILDEPANGLDPEGIRWMRELLRDFADRGGTALLSSHLIHEVEATADRLVIINHGQVVADGTRDELLSTDTGCLAAAEDMRALERALAERELSCRPGRDGSTLVVDAEARAVGEAALAAGVALTRLSPAESGGLEQLFFTLTTDSEASA